MRSFVFVLACLVSGKASGFRVKSRNADASSPSIPEEEKEAAASLHKDDFLFSCDPTRPSGTDEFLFPCEPESLHKESDFKRFALGLLSSAKKAASAFQVPPTGSAHNTAVRDKVSTQTLAAAPRTATAEMQFFGGGGKSTEEILEEKGYWAGEWLCADCGYVYQASVDPAFEELPNFWKCPQCAGPRRRFVKKAGDMVGNLDDSPFFIGTLATLLVIAGLVYYAVTV